VIFALGQWVVDMKKRKEKKKRHEFLMTFLAEQV
jgi:hypothetical protein